MVFPAKSRKQGLGKDKHFTCDRHIAVCALLHPLHRHHHTHRHRRRPRRLPPGGAEQKIGVATGGGTGGDLGQVYSPLTGIAAVQGQLVQHPTSQLMKELKGLPGGGFGGSDAVGTAKGFEKKGILPHVVGEGLHG